MFCDRKILLNLTPVINIRFIINKELQLIIRKSNLFCEPGRHTLLRVSFMHGLGIITTWVMQLFVMSMMISNVSNNHHDHHEYFMDGGIHIQGNEGNN